MGKIYPKGSNLQFYIGRPNQHTHFSIDFWQTMHPKHFKGWVGQSFLGQIQDGFLFLLKRQFDMSKIYMGGNFMRKVPTGTHKRSSGT